jgi:hypothetical protein
MTRSCGSATGSRTQRYPIMRCLSDFNIIIVDFADAYQLRASLMSAGATVHVVSPGGALVLARHKRIEAAFVGIAEWRARRLCEQLSALGVRQIIVTADEVGSERLRVERELPSEPVLSVARITQTVFPSF